MSTDTAIQGLASPERIAGTTISIWAPGQRGRARTLQQAGESRAAGDLLPLADAARDADAAVLLRALIELEPPTAAPAAAGGRGGAAGAASARLTVEARDDADYAVLHTDENGHSRWLFKSAQSTPQQALFDLPEPAPAPTAGSDGGRGPVTTAMRHLVRVVAWLTAPIVGAGARAAAWAWEQQRRPYGLWQLSPDGAGWVEPTWPAAGDTARTLLLIHGTFSTPQVGFAGWVGTPAFAPLAARYGGRVLALAHPSLSASPSDNVDWMLSNLPGPAALGTAIDIVCHSRGGLLAREIAARAATGAVPPVQRVCQVGTPNRGTPLANAGHWNDFIDAYTGCLTTLPDSTTTVVLEGLLCLVKIMGSGVARGLPGLAAMDPDGDSLAKIAAARAGGTRWYSVGASYRATAGSADAGWMARWRNRAEDGALRAFFGGDHDKVVPSDGCHAPGVAVAESLRLTGGDVDHCNYFGAPEVQAALARWLA